MSLASGVSDHWSWRGSCLLACKMRKYDKMRQCRREGSTAVGDSASQRKERGPVGKETCKTRERMLVLDS